jgi:hypothetical protein
LAFKAATSSVEDEDDEMEEEEGEEEATPCTDSNGMVKAVT